MMEKSQTNTNGNMNLYYQNFIIPDNRLSILFLPVIFLLATLIIYLLSSSFPNTSTSNQGCLRFPSSFEDLTAMTSYLTEYKSDNLWHVIVIFCFAYLYKQAFAIPGSVFLNILAGALFGQTYGFLFVCLLSACGASCCYLLAYYFGRSMVTYYFPDRIKFFQHKVADNSDGLFFYLLFLRLIPMSPNWFLNIGSAIVGIPVPLFFFSVLFGLMPYNFISVQTGVILSEIRSIDQVFTTSRMLQLLMLAVLFLTPGLIKRKLFRQKQRDKTV